MKKIFLLSALVLLSACSLYKREFDCTPSPGLACTSVTALENMIVEAPCGEDVFLGCTPKRVDVSNGKACKCTDNPTPEAPFQRRVWIASKEGRPTYIYFEEEPTCAVP